MDDGLTAPDWSYETFDGITGSEDHIYVSVKEALNEWIGTGGSRNGYHLPFLGSKEWVMDGGSDEDWWKDDFRNWIESLPKNMGRPKYTVNNPKVSPFSMATYWNPRGYPAWAVKKVSIEDYIESDPDDDYPVWLWTTNYDGRKFLHDKNAGVVFTEEGAIIEMGPLEDNFREGDTLEMLRYYDAGPRKRNIRLALNWLVWPEILTRR
jgi:hypothetical protein